MRARSAAFLLAVSMAPAGMGQIPRFTWVKGSVTVHSAAGSAVRAVAGAPLAVGDRLSLGLTGRATVQVDPANLLDLANGAELRITRLEKDAFAASILSGTAIHSVSGPSAAAIALDTPSVSVRAVQPGAYEVTITRFGATEIVPAGGALEVFAQSGSQWVSPGQKMIARGDPASPEFRIVNAVSRWRRLLARMGPISVQAGGSSGGDASSDKGKPRPTALKPSPQRPGVPNPPSRESPKPPPSSPAHGEAAKAAPAAASSASPASASHGK